MMKKAIVIILLVALCGGMMFSFTACDKRGQSGSSSRKAQFRCFKGCEGVTTYDKPGKCPVCGGPMMPIPPAMQAPGMPGMGMPGMEGGSE